MRKIQSILCGAFIASALTGVAYAQPLQQLDPSSQQMIQKPQPLIKPRLAPQAAPKLRLCPDPAVKAFRISNIRRVNGGRDIAFNITAVIRNDGGAAWNSRPGQQAATLSSRSGATRKLAQIDFTRLAPGEEKSISAAMRVDASAEFPPDIIVAIGYDPDIRLDSNEANDDCAASNNQRTLNGTDLMRQLHAAL